MGVAAAAQSEFLADVTHEVRTPINGIVGLLDLVLQTQLTAEQREYLDLARSSAGALLTMVNKVLDFSKIEAGGMQLERTGFSLRETLGDAMKALAVEAGRKGLEMACDVEPGVPDALVGDPVRLRQIVTNLVGNAVKFTARGEVVLTVRRIPGAGAKVACRFSVRDTGIGIDAAKLDAIFAPFVQADASTARVFGGTGLGLSIAARLVEAMGGSIAAESAPGQGSVFRFDLRFDRQETTRRERPDFSGRRVLAALHPVRRAALVAELRHWGAEVVEAEQGSDVAARIDATVAAPFDVVLLDAAVPGLDAWRLATRIGRGATRGAGTVAVLDSIFAPQRNADDIDRCGLVALSKPVKQSELLALMKTAAGRQTLPPAPIRIEPPARPLDVLLVEDNAINRRVAQQVLEKAGHRVTAADSAAAAFDALAHWTFDVVLMDVQMPGMDGMAATRLIRERERAGGVRVPVLALTAHAADHRERCLQAGMDGFLVKPIQPQELLDALAGIGCAAPRTMPRHARTLDHAVLLERVDHDLGMLAEVLALLGDRGAQLTAETRAALAARDAARSARLLHTLDGMFANLAADEAAERIGRVETLAAAGDWRAAGDEFARLEQDMERLTVEIGALAGMPVAAAQFGVAPPGTA